MIIKKEKIYELISDLLAFTNNLEKDFINLNDIKEKIEENLFKFVIDINIYCINFKNEERKERMKERFKKIGMENNLIFTNSVYLTDERLNSFNSEVKRNAAILYQHIDSLTHFLDNTNNQYCIVCEDDILISTEFKNNLPYILKRFEELNLDVMLLGYLLPYEIDMSTHLHKQYFKVLKEDNEYKFHEYPDDLWGSQMYLLNRNYAQFIIDKYYIERNSDKPLNPDWTITKDTNKRALINPMIALEEGVNVSDNQEQIDYHKLVFDTHYKEGKYL